MDRGESQECTLTKLTGCGLGLSDELYPLILQGAHISSTFELPMQPWRPLLCASFLVALSCAPGFAQESTPSSPCADSLYQGLKGKPLDQLTEREYAYFQQREKACTDYQRLTALVQESSSGAPITRGRPLTSESRTRENPIGGVDVFVRNTSDRSVIVNSIRVTECQNVRQASCGTHVPKVEIRPGQEHRIYTIRFGSKNQPTSYRYNYHISEAQP